MKYGVLDVVSVVKGKLTGNKGVVMGASQVHRGGIPDMPEYQVSFKDLKITEELKEEALLLVEKYDPVKEAKEKADQVAAERAEQARINEERQTKALRERIEKELELRDQIEKEFAAKKAAEKLTTE